MPATEPRAGAIPRPLDIREAVAISSVAGSRSFKLAAGMLNVSQPTLSRLISSAEEKLGVQIFSRGWSGAETTPRGDVVVRYCGHVVTALDKAQGEIGLDRPGAPALRTNLRTDQLDTIRAICSEGSMTHAARRLGRTQPVVSRVVADLSGRFGLAFFRREAGGMVALAPARTLVDLSGTIAYHLTRMHAQLRQLEGEIVGRVSVGMLPFSGQDLILRTFGALTNDHPHLRLVCVPGSYNGLVEALRRREIDRIVGIMRGPDCPEGLVETHLYDERFTVIARSDHPLHRSGRDPDALARTNWIVAPHGTPVRGHFERVFSDLGLTPPTQTCELLSFGSAEQMLVDSNAAAMLTYSDRKLAGLRPDLARVDTGFPDRPAPIGLTRLAMAEDDPALREFDARFRAVVERDA
ncbi:MAG: LysR family transcriptional regulator [Maritimibacter sp.]|uniref:LysR family transcriptional regulator n=1 Tax=Maritimibacter sp. TaxID=2003363 RepID=UPI001DC52048|nr:LysR family transcriptional regulator [Maritimibacter sp.]MBL6430087.1 LysR family transcriptional regulator [Maritimibacter sp.]